MSESPVDRQPRNTRYALFLALGEYMLNDIPESQREDLLKQLADTYRDDPSSGVHGAAGWLLRHWGQNEAVREVDQTAVPYTTEREWFTLAMTVTPTSPPKPKEKPADDKGERESKTEQEDPKPEPLPPKTFYYTFVVFPAGQSEIGSVSDEPDRQRIEVRHSVTLSRHFALLDREITMEELIAFQPRYARSMQNFESKPSDAGFEADWYDSVAFCRWLGAQSGMLEGDQSYADPESLSKEEYPREPNPLANWAPRDWPLQLGRPGFRLPTESEWEVASRRGVRTAYAYGSEVGLLGHFGWFLENSGKHVHPPKELRPSISGMFDMHGNLFEWTDDSLSDFWGTFCRVYRGATWYNVAADCRTSIPMSAVPTYRTSGNGFRVALSLSVKSPEAGQGATPSGVGTEGASAE